MKRKTSFVLVSIAVYLVWGFVKAQSQAIVECNQPAITNGSVTPANATVEQGETYVASCDSGFKIAGSTTMTCQLNGTFSFDHTPTCEEAAAVQVTLTSAEHEITPDTVTQKYVTLNGSEWIEEAGYLVDKNLSTGTIVSIPELEGEIRSMELKFKTSYSISEIVIYHSFYTDWYDPDAWFVQNLSSYQTYKDRYSHVNIFVYNRDVLAAHKTLQLTYGLDQAEQIYTLQYESVGDTILLSKPTGEITVWEIVVTGEEIRVPEPRPTHVTEGPIVNYPVLAALLGSVLFVVLLVCGIRTIKRNLRKTVTPDIVTTDLDYIFLSHDWQPLLIDDHHRKVMFIDEELKKRGYVTFLSDKVQTTGYEGIGDMTFQKIDRSKVVLVFITRRYCDKIAGTNLTEACKREFDYSLQHKGARHMIPVVIDDTMKDGYSWAGTQGMSKGVDFSGDNEQVLAAWGTLENEIATRILRRMSHDI